MVHLVVLTCTLHLLTVLQSQVYMDLAQLAASSPEWRQAIAMDADQDEIKRKRKLEREGRATTEMMQQRGQVKAARTAAGKERELRRQKRQAATESALLYSEEADRIGSAAFVGIHHASQREEGLDSVDPARQEDDRLLYQFFFGSQEVADDGHGTPEDTGFQQLVEDE